MSEPQILIVGGERRRGRPPAIEPRAPVSTRLEASLHDRLIRLAASERKSVSEIVRSLLVLQLRRPF